MCGVGIRGGALLPVLFFPVLEHLPVERGYTEKDGRAKALQVAEYALGIRGLGVEHHRSADGEGEIACIAEAVSKEEACRREEDVVLGQLQHALSKGVRS